MRTVCNINKCTGCYACEELCPKNAIHIVDSVDSFNAIIDGELCVDCKICENVCQIHHPVEKKDQIQWVQGWSNDEETRKRSSSGGAAAELAKTVINMGGYVCSCKFKNGEFVFEFAENMEQLKGFQGSKYVKSNPKGIYKIAKKLLTEGEIVLFIGLPCQCAALKQTTSNIKKGKLYTVDLICHGTPSPKLLELFMEQYELSLDYMETIKFRGDDCFALQENDRYIVTPGTMDCYSIAFLNGMTYTENCYECYYAESKRSTDLTIGDSWGTELPGCEKGISLILCNTENGKELLEKSNMYLTEANIEKAIESNPQLKAPTEKMKKRAYFFEGLKNGQKFNALVMKYCTKRWFRQYVKKQLIRFGFIK